MDTKEQEIQDEVSVEAKEREIASPAKTINMGSFLKKLAGMVEDGEVDKFQAKELRRQLGLSQSFFTHKKRDKDKEKRRKKIAKASRRRNRGQGKGQKRTKGFGVFTRT